MIKVVISKSLKHLNIQCPECKNMINMSDFSNSNIANIKCERCLKEFERVFTFYFYFKKHISS